MAEPYLERLNAILRAARPIKPRGVRLACRHFFGGAALYANETICASLTPAGFAVKLPEDSRTALLQECRGTPLRYFKGAPIKKEYVVLSVSIASDQAAIRAFLRESIRFATRANNPRPTRTGRVLPNKRLKRTRACTSRHGRARATSRGRCCHRTEGW